MGPGSKSFRPHYLCFILGLIRGRLLRLTWGFLELGVLMHMITGPPRMESSTPA